MISTEAAGALASYEILIGMMAILLQKTLTWDRGDRKGWQTRDRSVRPRPRARTRAASSEWKARFFVSSYFGNLQENLPRLRTGKLARACRGREGRPASARIGST